MKSTKKTKKSHRKTGAFRRARRRARPAARAAAARVADDAARGAGDRCTFDELAARIGRDGASAQQRLQSAARSAAARRRDHSQPPRRVLPARARLPLIVGTVSGHRDGHGFVHAGRSLGARLPAAAPDARNHAWRPRRRARQRPGSSRPAAKASIVEVLERNTQRDRRPAVRRVRHQLRRAGQSAHRSSRARAARSPRRRARRPGRAGQAGRAAVAHRAAARPRHARARRARRAGHGNRDRDSFARSAVRVSARGGGRGREHSVTRSARPRSAGARICASCRWSRSTARMRAISTTRCAASQCAAAGG